MHDAAASRAHPLAWWMDSSTVWPLRARRARQRTTCSPLSESSPLSGSSRNTIWGCCRAAGAGRGQDRAALAGQGERGACAAQRSAVSGQSMAAGKTPSPASSCARALISSMPTAVHLERSAGALQAWAGVSSPGAEHGRACHASAPCSLVTRRRWPPLSPRAPIVLSPISRSAQSTRSCAAPVGDSQMGSKERKGEHQWLAGWLAGWMDGWLLFSNLVKQVKQRTSSSSSSSTRSSLASRGSARGRRSSAAVVSASRTVSRCGSTSCAGQRGMESKARGGSVELA